MTLRRWHRALTVGLLTAWGAPLAQAGEPPCELRVSIQPDLSSQARALDVTLAFPANERRETALRAQPEWAGVRDFAAALVGWRGLSPDTQVSPAAEPGRWLVRHPPGGTVQLAYRALADLPDPDDGQPQDQSHLYRTQIGADWFQFFGYGVLPSVEPWADDRPTQLCVDILQPGQADAPAFGSHLNGRGPLVQAAWRGTPEGLRHAFYGGGKGWRVWRRDLPSGPLMAAVRGRFAVDDTAFIDQSAALVGLHRRFWGDTRVPTQWLVLTPNFMRGNSGGTLVTQAAVLHAPPEFSPALPAFEFLIGHENLHQWFPERFGTRHPEDEVHDYWFSEGFTNHYTHRLLLASGLWTPARYAQALTEVLQGYWRSPAREAPVASISPRFFSDRDAGQQLYARGELLALRWDRALRERDSALDPVLRGLLLPAEATAGPSAAERVLRALEPLLGELPRRDVQAHVTQGRVLPLDPGLAGPCFTLDWVEQPRWSLGFDRASFQGKVLQGVDPAGPAHAAGLRDGMALAGWSVHGGQVERPVDLDLRRDGAVVRISYLPVQGLERLPRVQSRPDTSDSAACQAWLRAD